MQWSVLHQNRRGHEGSESWIDVLGHHLVRLRSEVEVRETAGEGVRFASADQPNNRAEVLQRQQHFQAFAGPSCWRQLTF